jgi:hypothetical protein
MSTIRVETAETPFEDAVTRARAEFMEMPGLQLTLEQAARLWHLERESCEAILSTLVQTGFLVRTARAAFARNSHA